MFSTDDLVMYLIQFLEPVDGLNASMVSRRFMRQRKKLVQIVENNINCSITHVYVSIRDSKLLSTLRTKGELGPNCKRYKRTSLDQLNRVKRLLGDKEEMIIHCVTQA